MMSERLEHLPVALFTSVMGLAGLAMALHQAHVVLGLPALPGRAVTLLAGLVFVVLAVLYAVKAARFPSAALADFQHPVRMSFTASISVSLVLLAILVQPFGNGLSFALWAAGAVLHIVLTLYVLSVWVYQPRFQIHHINPAWFIPVVGNILVPIVGVHHAGWELSWFFFSVGLLFWIVLFTIIIYRMIFHQPLPERLLPTLFILIAPPAVGFIAYLRLNPELDGFARVLYYSALFITVWLLLQAPRFLRLPFYLSWWAYSFPLTAMTVATLTMGQLTGAAGLYGIGYVLLGLSVLVVFWLAARTLLAAWRGQICVPEPDAAPPA